MSAAILRFPSPMTAPTVRPGRKGRLPHRVRSLKAYRLERQQKQEDVDAANAAGVKQLCIETLYRVQCGQVTGLVVIEARGGNPDTVYATGKFADVKYLERSLSGFAGLASAGILKAC